MSESSDPMVIKDRGFNFNGVATQATLEYNDSGIILSPNFSLYFWGRNNAGDVYILSRIDQNNIPIFSFKMSEGKITFEIHHVANQYTKNMSVY